ncbi:MAG: hypothetical protein HOK25_15650 [Rhodospirillaceae bacterium]|nr:hypothetical protein [Rhodospirillaceae bacterium]
MIKRTVRGAIQLVGGLGAGFAIIVLLIAWQFSRGPIPLGFLSPYIEETVNDGSREFTLKMGDTILTWAGWERALDIRVLDVRVIDTAGTTIGSIPEVSFSISGEALVRGRLAPKSIELFGPKIRLRRDRDGTIDIGFSGQTSKSGVLALGLINQLLEPSPSRQTLEYLTHVAIIGGDVTVADQVLKKSWHMPAADLRLVRYIDRVGGEMSLLMDIGERQTELKLSGEYMMPAKRLNLNIDFKDVAPAVFAAVASDLAPLQALDMPFSGQVSLGMPIDGTVDRLGVEIKGGPGKLILPKPFAQTLGVASVKLKAGFSGPRARADIQSFVVDLVPDSRIQLPAPFNHAMPVRGFTFKGSVVDGGDTLNITSLDAALDGPIASISGAVSGLAKSNAPVDISITGNLKNTPIDRLTSYWPAALGTDAQTWVTKHISKGMAPRADMKGQFKVHPGGVLEVVALDGTMNVKGATVVYLSPMPKVENVNARMEFDRSSYTVHIDKGTSGGVTLKGGTVIITGLDQFDQFADIDLRLEGDLNKQLNYIDHKPLQFATALGIDPKSAAGQGATRLKLHFILEHTLGFEQVQVWARSSLTNVKLANVYLGRAIKGGTLDLKVDRRGMDVSGDVSFDNIPASLSWRENFMPGQKFKSRYAVRAKIIDVNHIRDLGLVMDPFSGDYVRGAVDANIEYTILDDIDRRLKVSADITQASLAAPAFGWSKKAGEEGRAEIVVNVERSLVSDIPSFKLSAPDMEIVGNAKYATDGTGLERIDFSKIMMGRTNMKGALLPKPDGGWEAGFHGPSFDLSSIWNDIVAKASDQGTENNRMLDKVTLAVEFDKVWLDPKISIKKVSGTFARDQELWQTILLSSTVGLDTDVNLEVRPGADGNRTLSMRSNNAGTVLSMLDLYPNMIGGTLRIDGTYDDAAPGQPLKGIVSIKDYRVTNAPVLAHLLSIMALSGILDALEGDGLAFNDLQVPFELNQGTFHLKEARATGAALGFTASGKVFRHADVVDLEGTVIPAYALNSVFGRIPLLGDILTGGEEGGGVFAARYTMTGPTEEPIVSVNPLSALTPGILRNVFGIFGKADTPPKFPGSEPSESESN